MKDLTFSEKLMLISTTIVAAMALFVSVWQANETRKHNRLSVKPILNFERSYNYSIQNTSNTKGEITKRDTVTKYILNFKNTGIGPAIITSFEIYQNNKELNISDTRTPWKKIRSEKNGVLNTFEGYSWYEKGDVFPVGMKSQLLKCLFNKELLKEIKIVVRYESIYEEKFTVEYQLEN